MYFLIHTNVSNKQTSAFINLKKYLGFPYINMAHNYTRHGGFDQALMTHSSKSSGHIPRGTKYEHLITPSTSAPSFGSPVTIQFRQKNVDLSQLILEFYLTAISGTTSVETSSVSYVSAFYFWDKCEILVAGQTVDTIYSWQNFLVHQLFHDTEERTHINTAAGDYASHSSRATKSASANYWYCPLFSAFNVSSYPFLQNSGDLELRIWLNPISSCYTVSSSGTASNISGSISALNLITRQTRHPNHVWNALGTLFRKASALDYPILDSKTQSWTITSSSTASLVMSSITGYVPYIVFVIRSSSPTGSSQWTYNTTLTQFEILSSSSENIVGGQPVKDEFARLILGHQWSNSLYLTESSGAFIYSFCASPEEAMNGINTGGHVFSGSEQLKLTFSSAQTVQVDLYAPTYAALRSNGQTLQKFSLSG